MCLPAAAIAIIAAGAQAAGTLVQGYSAMQQGNYEAAVDKQNAVLAHNAANESIKQGQVEARDFYRKVGQVKGQEAASMAANGIELGYGSANRIEQDTQMQANEDASTLYKNINERTKGFAIESGNYLMDAKAKKQQGLAAFVGSAFGAASSALGGFQQAKMIKGKIGTSSAYG